MNSRKPSAAKKQLILAIGILFIGMCLRAPFTSIGPLLEIVQKSLHLSTTAIGLVNALPLLAFATVSPMVPSVSRKLGLELALGMALVLVGGGVLLRSLGHIWSLYMGTALLGCGIAIQCPAAEPRQTGLSRLNPSTDSSVRTKHGHKRSTRISSRRPVGAVSRLGVGTRVGLLGFASTGSQRSLAPTTGCTE